jgi:hypothetical protein
MSYQDALRKLRIVDPACGSGVFLVIAFDFLKAEYERVNKKLEQLRGREGALSDVEAIDSDILSNNLYGVDVNAESIEITKISLWLKTARRGKVLDSLDHNLRVGDSLIEDASFAYLEHGFSWRPAFPEVFVEGGFDVVLSNPPYVRMELIKTMKPYLERRFQVVADRADLYCYFYERGLSLLKQGGRLGFISSSSFFKTGSGAPLREFLIANATLESVTDFGDLRVFDGITTYPVIMTMKRSAALPEHNLRFWKLHTRPAENFSAAFDENAELYPQLSLTGASWEFEAAAPRELRRKIRSGKPTLKDVYGSPSYGIKTGLNAAFYIDGHVRAKLIAQDPRSADLIRPLAVGDDAERWRIERRDTWIIYVPKGSIDINRFEALRSHLLPYKEKLERRATQQEWFELQQSQHAYVHDFENGKIIYPEMSQGRKFSFHDGVLYVNNKAFYIASTDKFLLALLNSKLIWFFLRGVSASLRGGEWRLELRSQYVDTIPIPDAEESERAALARLSGRCLAAARERFERQDAVRRRIPDLCPLHRSPKLTTKLREWWRFPNFGAFRAEIRKVFGVDVPLAERP